MTQQPALSVPCGFTGRRPAGGPAARRARHADALVLRAGRAYERATDWSARRPALLDRNRTPDPH